MSPTKQREAVEEVTEWLYNAANRHNLSNQFKATHFRTEGKWLHYGVRLGSGDAFERAKILIDLEDEWDAREANSEWRLMLEPAG